MSPLPALFVLLLLQPGLTPKSLDEAKAWLATNPGDTYVLNYLKRNPNIEALDILREAFPRIPDDDNIKSDIASHLYRKNVGPEYFDWLFARAQAAIDRDLPLFDLPTKKSLEEQPPAWKKERRALNLELNDCALQAMYKDPGAVLNLGIIRDPRSYDLLAKGLNSRNPVIVISSVNCLGLLGRPEAIPLIEARLRRDTLENRLVYLTALGDFHTPAADAIIDRYELDPKKRAMYRQGSLLSRIPRP